MQTAGVTTLALHWFAGTADANEPDGADVGRLTMEEIPVEVLTQIIHADPESALRLMDTSHHYQSIVLGTVLRHLLDTFGGSIPCLRRFIREALRAGKTPAEIVLLSRLLGQKDIAGKGRCLVQMGMLNLRAHNALCSGFLELLCRPDVALYAFLLDFPLLGTDDLRQRKRLTPYVLPSGGGRAERIDGRDVHVNRLDNVLLHLAPSLREADIVSLYDKQYAHSRRLTHPLILPSADAGVVVRPEDYSRHDEDHIAYVASWDAAFVALSILRFLSATTLRSLKAPHEADGALYDAMFAAGGRNQLAAVMADQSRRLPHGRPDVETDRDARATPSRSRQIRPPGNSGRKSDNSCNVL
ncbi:hypothetical protein L602_002800000700 [Cupriavidus gilardii J11]|uniref:Uncharacterized protein n=1 Tax=Cupriavidus gilardii J11 TaxID=936133 RepID=A0A562BGS4_9BURK|nr:hypothetical protein [Cupriavidus gilardii]TWG84271.1 hypothetical protein L602_002800000700 [Cupriavidus gilardii J11]